MKRFIGFSDMANYGLNEKTMRNKRSKGELPPAYAIGGRILFDREEFEAWLEAQREIDAAARK